MRKLFLACLLGLPLRLIATHACNAEAIDDEIIMNSFFTELQSNHVSAKKKNEIIEYQLDWPSGPPGTHDIVV